LRASVHATRQRRDGRVLKHVAGGDVENAGAAAIGNHLDAKNRVAAEDKEVVVYSYAFKSEDCGPDCCNLPFAL
jgi:hypothetical protein